MKHRMCRVLLCLVLTFALLLPMTVGALADTTIGTDASRPEYFEALGGSGSYNPLKTPYHYDKTTGNVAYCLEHKKDSPSSSAAYTDFDPSALWRHNTVTGIQAAHRAAWCACIPPTRSGRCRAINWSRASRFPAPTATPSAAAARRWTLQATPAAQKIGSPSPRRSRC